jgi:hypothetical protein
MDLCVEACRQFGGGAEMIAVLLFLGRWLWSEVKRRKLAGEREELRTEKESLRVEKAELEGQVKLLSLRPPSIGGPSLQELAVQITGQVEPPASPDQVDVLVGTEEPPTSKS